MRYRARAVDVGLQGGGAARSRFRIGVADVEPGRSVWRRISGPEPSSSSAALGVENLSGQLEKGGFSASRHGPEPMEPSDEG
jgi:hypothetical protein